MRTICFVLLAQTLLSAATPTPISFFARRDTPVGSGNLLGASHSPTGLVLADFNGDGRPDVAVVSASTNALIVYINQDNGSFKGGPVMNVGLTPTAVVAGDFNGDGKQDLAVVSLSGLGILLGNGDGTFQKLVNIRDAFGNALAVADFNGDGNLDLIVGDSQFATLDLLLGNGNGTFQAMTPLGLAGNPVTLAVADLNNDGKPDLVVATGSDDQIVTILNKGKGTFDPPVAFTVPGATALAIGDFNGDGNLDVACASLVNGAAAVVLLLGEGNGQLGSATPIVSEGSPTGVAAVAAGDFNGDGHLDLVAISTELGNDETLVLLGNGDGTFQKPAAYTMSGPALLATADFNGDHKTDILTADVFVDVSLLTVLLGKGDGTFQVAPQTTLTAFAAGATSVGMVSADLNGDGLTDFVVAESTGAQVLLGSGDDQFTAGQFIATVANAIALADVNGDGIPDLIMTTSGNDVMVFLGNGDGTFQAALGSNANSSQYYLAVGDFNGDGKPDLALIVEGGNLSVMLGDGKGKFAKPTQTFTVGTEAGSIAVGDFNKDGNLDVVVANFGEPGFGPSSISLLLGNGDGTFQPQTHLPLPPNAGPWEVVVADLNGDGNLDIVSSNNNESYLSIYLGNGDGTFQQPTKAPCGFAPENLVILDFNGDGIPDIAFMDFGEEDAGVLAGNGDGTFAPAVWFGANSFPIQIAGGTLTQGGKPGLVLVNNGFAQVPAVAYTVLRNISK
jgi:hypothetical protein